MTPFLTRDAFDQETRAWELLPFRFGRTQGTHVLVTNMVGEHTFVDESQLQLVVHHDPRADPALLARLRAKHIIRDPGDPLPLELLALKVRTRYWRLGQFTGLHIFVVSLRCEHSCPYCQVSRQSEDKTRYDMSEETARRALEMVFQSPSERIKIEFQGGEPLLNFPRVEQIVEAAEELNEHYQRNLSFVIATNLALLDEHVLDYCDEHDIAISTSLDGPADIHNSNRPRPDRDSWERAVEGIQRVRERLGPHRLSALMTTTSRSLERVRDIVDCYVENDLRSIFLRPLSPYGFAIRTKSHAAYDAERWLRFYEDGLDYIIELNQQGVHLRETYAGLILKKMLTNDDPGYVDLTSPAGIGIGAVVYNYDGDVYASDEGRMLAEMGDNTFKLGNLHSNTYSEIMLSDALLEPLERSFTLSAPMCNDCVFEAFCGADPVFHHATSGDFLGRKPLSAFCQRNMRIFQVLLERFESDPYARTLFRQWATA